MSNILIVEDNDAVAMGLKYALVKEGYSVSRAANAEEAYDLARTHDLIILDIRLPGEDGFEFCRRLRAAGYTQPILMLTARDDLIDKVIGLEVGADDYMTKPFELREVIARIRALLRRSYGVLADPPQHSLRFENLEIDFASQIAKRDGQDLQLTPTELRLLAYLAQHPQKTYDRLTLLEKVWGYEYLAGDPRNIDVHIRNLRQKIETNPQEPKLILTVRGVGYRFEPPATH